MASGGNEKENKKTGRLQIIIAGICVAAACAAGCALAFWGGKTPPSLERIAMEEEITTEQNVDESAVDEEVIVTEPQEEYAASDIPEETTETESTEEEPETVPPKYDADVKIASMTLSQSDPDSRRQFFFDEKGGISKENLYKVNANSMEWYCSYEDDYFQDADGNAVLMLVPEEAWWDRDWFDDSNDKSVEDCYMFYPCLSDNGYFLDENGCYVETSSWGDKIIYDEQNRRVEISDSEEITTYQYEDTYILRDTHSVDGQESYAQVRFELNEDGHVMSYCDNFHMHFEDNGWLEVHYTRNEQNKWITKETFEKNDNGLEKLLGVEEREFDSQGRITKYEHKGTDGEDEVYYPVYGQDGQLEKVEKVIKTYDGAVREAQNTYTYDEYGRLVRETVQTWSNSNGFEEVPYYLVEEEFTVTYNEKGLPVEMHNGELNRLLVKEYYGAAMQQIFYYHMIGKNVTYFTYEYY